VDITRRQYLSQNAPNEARRDIRRDWASCRSRSRLWHLPLSHLSPSLRVIPCEYVDDPYIANVNEIPSVKLLTIAHYYWLHQLKARKNADNPLIRGSGSFNVTDFGTNRKLVVDFL